MYLARLKVTHVCEHSTGLEGGARAGSFPVAPAAEPPGVGAGGESRGDGLHQAPPTPEGRPRITPDHQWMGASAGLAQGLGAEGSSGLVCLWPGSLSGRDAVLSLLQSPEAWHLVAPGCPCGCMGGQLLHPEGLLDTREWHFRLVPIALGCMGSCSEAGRLMGSRDWEDRHCITPHGQIPDLGSSCACSAGCAGEGPVGEHAAEH